MHGSWNPSQWHLISNATSTLIKKAAGLATMQGIICATSSSLVVQVWDSVDGITGAQVTGSITLTAGQSYPVPAKLNNGLYIVVVSGSGVFTVFYD